MNARQHLFYRTRLLFFATLVVAFTAALGLSACETEEEPQIIEEETPPMQQEEPTTGISELQGDPQEYVGQTVTVDGRVSTIHDQNTFTVTGGLFTGDLAVIVPPNVTAVPVSEGEEYRITGTVQTFVASDIEAQYGVDLGTDLENEIEEQDPVLIAESVTPMQEQGGYEGPAGTPERGAVPGETETPQGGDL